ncbi:MAG TPA: NAD(P)H-dependent oxidoreductase [Patescibacteria group bacterium]|nr:NAD(P)H-dependent oxidoreductase [Patescibacteria group bacterium]
MNVLIINAHLNYPSWSEGTLNRSMIEEAKTFLTQFGHTVAETSVEAGYDPEEEVQKHVDAGAVILQTPINWFGAPWIYKKYVDEVFNAGLRSKVLLDNDGRTRSDPTRQYGTGGHMQGRKFMISTTWNAPETAFSNPGGVLMEGKSADELLLNISANYKFVGFDILPSYGMYDIFKENADITLGIERFKKHLAKHVANAL